MSFISGCLSHRTEVQFKIVRRGNLDQNLNLPACAPGIWDQIGKETSQRLQEIGGGLNVVVEFR